MDTAYAILTFVQAALPTIGIAALFVLVVVLLVRRGEAGERVLLEWAQRLFDWLLPTPAGKQRQIYRFRKRNAVRLAAREFQSEWLVRENIRQAKR